VWRYRDGSRWRRKRRSGRGRRALLSSPFFFFFPIRRGRRSAVVGYTAGPHIPLFFFSSSRQDAGLPLQPPAREAFLFLLPSLLVRRPRVSIEAPGSSFRARRIRWSVRGRRRVHYSPFLPPPFSSYYRAWPGGVEGRDVFFPREGHDAEQMDPVAFPYSLPPSPLFLLFSLSLSASTAGAKLTAMAD